MLIMTQLSGFGAGSINPPFIDVITGLGLTANLKLCLDAGDSNSYASGQSWLDVAGSGDYDFYRGADGSPATDDATFNGAAGGLSANEYWSFDGGDFLRQVVATDDFGTDVSDAFHKDNAAFTLFTAVYLASGSTTFFGTNNGGSAIGLQWGQTGTNVNRLVVAHGSGTAMDSGWADDATPLNQWVTQAVVVDEAAGAGGGFMWRDGAYNQVGSSDTWDASYTTPSASAASEETAIAANGVGSTGFLPSGSRMALFAAFDAALTKANLDDIFAQTRGRFGI